MSPRMRTLTEPFKIKMVEPLKITTEEYREKVLRDAGYNPFGILSEDVFIDLLTDSGTGAMSDKQWAGIMTGDESYAGAKSWEHLETVVQELTGMPHILPTHQGRAAERILYGILCSSEEKRNKVITISNTHFDTTRANIECTGATALDIPYDSALDLEIDLPFKGNMDLEKLQALISEYGRENVAAVIITVTNNSSGGQPVSMANVKGLRKICDENQLILVVDSCRIAENAYFIKHGEPGYETKSYNEIAQEMLRLGDAVIMSGKKDGLVNIGGFLAMKEEGLFLKCLNILIITEGFQTYGGMAGRDMEAFAIGLKEVFDKDYLHYRIKSTAYLGEKLRNKGVPVVWPIGGHAVYIDARKMYPLVPVDQYPGMVLVCELYTRGGIRSVEVGSVMFGKYGEDGHLIPAQNELVRLALPRRVYTQSHLDYVSDVFDDILDTCKKTTSGYRITYEQHFLRHFTARFEKII